MKLSQSCFIIIWIIKSSFRITANEILYSSCGIDKSPMTRIYEGWAKIEHYPWMGYLIYPFEKRQITTAVILVSRQMVVASASEIDRLPKTDFRRVSKVILGSNCSDRQINVKEYTYHPEYRRSLYNDLALIQLDVDMLQEELAPICPPPTHFIDPVFYAIALGDDCKDSKIQIHRMSSVSVEDCRRFYRKHGLNTDTMWPRYTACAKTLQDSGNCVWRSGTALVMRQGERWLLLGFGVYGPGCSSPARFVDYGMYHDWVKTSLLRIGRPAITRMGPSKVIVRKTVSSLQRFGPCESEEMKDKIYTDEIEINMAYEEAGFYKKAYYNITLYTNVEYSCVQFQARYLGSYRNWKQLPQLHLRRWCAGPRAMCYDAQYLQIDFYVEIYFVQTVLFQIIAYGRQPKIIDPKRVYRFMNNSTKEYPELPILSTPPSIVQLPNILPNAVVAGIVKNLP